MILIALASWAVFSIVVAAIADIIGRDWRRYFILSLVLSPILVSLFILFSKEDQKDDLQFIEDIKNEFIAKFDANIGVNIENIPALILYTDIINGDEVGLDEVIELLQTLD